MGDIFSFRALAICLAFGLCFLQNKCEAQTLGGCNFVVEITPSGPTTICGGDSLILTATAGESYDWSNGETTQSITVFFPGDYSVTVVDEFGCEDTDNINVSVLPGAFAQIFPNQPPPYCQGDTVTLFTPFIPFTDYEWSTGETSLAITVTTSDIYTVTVTNSFGCSDTAQLPMFFIPTLPVFVFENGPTTFCEGGSVNLTSSFSFGGSYEWHPTGQTTQSISVTESGTYNVTVVNGAGCANTSDDIEVTVIPLPDANAGNDTVICEPTPLTLNASGGDSYIWSTGEAGAEITVEPTEGENMYIVTASRQGCNPTSMDTVIVEVSSGVQAGFTNNETLLGETVFFTDATIGNISSWHWDFGDGDTSELIDPSHVFNELGEQTVTLIVVDESGCTDTTQRIIDIVRSTIIPNVFTPNQDGINDIFRIPGGGSGYIDFAVYDRWGHEVYRSNAAEVQWNGRTNSGIELGPGIYYYTLTLDVLSDKPSTDHNGFITLIR